MVLAISVNLILSDLKNLCPSGCIDSADNILDIIFVTFFTLSRY